MVAVPGVAESIGPSLPRVMTTERMSVLVSVAQLVPPSLAVPNPGPTPRCRYSGPGSRVPPRPNRSWTRGHQLPLNHCSWSAAGVTPGVGGGAVPPTTVAAAVPPRVRPLLAVAVTTVTLVVVPEGAM